MTNTWFHKQSFSATTFERSNSCKKQKSLSRNDTGTLARRVLLKPQLGLGDLFPGTGTAGSANFRLKWGNNERSFGGGWCLGQVARGACRTLGPPRTSYRAANHSGKHGKESSTATKIVHRVLTAGLIISRKMSDSASTSASIGTQRFDSFHSQRFSSLSPPRLQKQQKTKHDPCRLKKCFMYVQDCGFQRQKIRR